MSRFVPRSLTGVVLIALLDGAGHAERLAGLGQHHLDTAANKAAIVYASMGAFTAPCLPIKSASWTTAPSTCSSRENSRCGWHNRINGSHEQS